MTIPRKAVISALAWLALPACGGGLATTPAPGPTTDPLIESLTANAIPVIQGLFDLRSTAYCERNQELLTQVDAPGSTADEEDRSSIRRGAPCDRIIVREAVFYSADRRECTYFLVPEHETARCAAFATRVTDSGGRDAFRKVVLTWDPEPARWLFAGTTEQPPPPK